MHKEDLALNNLQGLICHKTYPNPTKSHVYKVDLALNNLQWLICHKTKPINECPLILLKTKEKKVSRQSRAKEIDNYKKKKKQGRSWKEFT